MLDFGFGQRIKRARRLVEDQDRRIFEENAGNRNALLLPAGKERAAFADVGVEAVWHGQNVVVNLRALRGLHDFIHRRVGLSVADVLQNRVGKQEHVLLHNADIPAQALLREAANIQPVKKDFAGRDVIKARDELAERRLAAAGGADDRDGLAGGDMERDIVEHRKVAVIRKADVLEIDFALDMRQLQCTGRVL